jgi:HK97 family phage major capsid protein
MTEVKPLREEYAELHAQAEALVALTEKENRDLKDDEQKQFNDAHERMKTIKAIESRKAQLAEVAFAEKKANVELPTEPEGKAEAAAVEIRVGTTYDAKNIDKQKFSAAMNRWFLNGYMDDRRYATITTATQSGALLPKEVLTPIIPGNVNVFREAHNVLGLTPLYTPTTHDISLPVLSATAGGTVSQTASSETENAPSLERKLFCPSVSHLPVRFGVVQRQAASGREL